MIGVAFRLEGALSAHDRVERTAFERVTETLAREHGWPVDRTRLDDILRATDWDRLPRSAIAQIFSSVFAPTPLSEVEKLPLEALFRMTGARCVGQNFAPFDDVAPMLRELAAMNVPRVLLSSGWSGIVQRKAERLGFDGPLLLGENLDAPLMSPQMLAHVTRTLMLPADRIWFVGSDVRRDLSPAQAVGMHTVWLNRETANPPADIPPPDVTIASLSELVPMLSEPYTRGVLALRYILRTVLEWRPGHVLSATDSCDDEGTAPER